MEEMVQARRKAGYGDATAFLPDGQALDWPEGGIIPMRRSEAEGRADVEIVPAKKAQVEAPPPAKSTEEEK
mgnify:CR=1 FL=1|jgi:hypothetical protein